MTQPSYLASAPPLDLRSIRTSFLDKGIAYALSFGFTLESTGLVRKDERSLQLGLRAPPSPGANDVVFHVLGGDRVPGLDKKGRDLPAGFVVKPLDATILFHAQQDPSLAPLEDQELVFASLQGRLTFEATPSDARTRGEKTDGEPIRISVSYDGTIQPRETTTFAALKLPPAQAIRASAFVAPFFETTHPKYHWLTENACIAYGTWALEESGAIVASFDVYTVE